MTYEELKEVFAKLTFILRGYTLEDYENRVSEAQTLIREAYAKDSQPFQGITDKVSYYWVNYADSDVNKIMNTNNRGYDSETEKFTFERKQTRQLNAHWIFYGDSAQDLGFAFRQQLFSLKAKDFLDIYGIKLVLGVPEAVLLFEEINNQNWGRVELTVDYYITSDYDEEVYAIKSAAVNLMTDEQTFEIEVNESED